jgi:hypothetical protein
MSFSDIHMQYSEAILRTLFETKQSIVLAATARTMAT